VTGDATAVEGTVTVGRAGKTGAVDAAGTVGVVSLVTCAGGAGAVKLAVGFETVIAGDAVVDLKLSKAFSSVFVTAMDASRNKFPVVNEGMGGSWVAAVPKMAAAPAPVVTALTAGGIAATKGTAASAVPIGLKETRPPPGPGPTSAGPANGDVA